MGVPLHVPGVPPGVPRRRPARPREQAQWVVVLDLDASLSPLLRGEVGKQPRLEAYFVGPHGALRVPRCGYIAKARRGELMAK